MSLVLQDELLISPKTKEQVIQNTADIRAIEEKIKTGVYKFKGTVEKYSDLPKENVEIGDVYNVKLADKKHGILAGDNVCWDGEDWDNLGSFIDLEPYALVADLELEKNTRVTADNGIITDLNKEIQDRTNADSNILESLDTVNTNLINNITTVSDNLTTESTTRQTNDTKIINNIWSNSTMSGGYFKTKNTQADTSYGQLWNENSGGGIQYYNKPENILSFVGVNKSSASDMVDVQIYAKDKTSNIGTRVNVSATEGMYYLKNCKNLGFPAEREVAVISDINTLDGKISSEENTRIEADNSLSNLISQEEASRIEKDYKLSQEIITEVNRAEAAEENLDDSKANKSDVYTKAEADTKYLTEHQDISNKIDKYASLSNSNEIIGKIVQYVGETETYKNGYFYKYVGEPGVTFTPIEETYNINVIVSLEDFKALLTEKCEGRPFTAEDITHGQIGYYNSERYSFSATTDDGKFFHMTMTPAEFEEAGITFEPAIGPRQGVRFTCNLTNDTWKQIDVQPKQDISNLATKSELNSAVNTLTGTINTKANSDDVYNKDETDTKDENVKRDIYSHIWSNVNNPNVGYFKTKYNGNDGSYALLFNETDGGGSQYYNKSLNSLQYVGTNDGNDGVYVQIYAKDKTTNIGARLAASPSGIFYTNGKANGSYTSTDEIITKANLNSEIALINSSLNEKANADNVYTKAEINAKLSSAMHFMGTKQTYGDLPNNPEIGDMWNILDTGINYAWDGENWDKLSETIDLTPYALKSEVNEDLLTKANVNDVYTKQQADAKFLTDHQDISNLATKDELGIEITNRETFDNTLLSKIWSKNTLTSGYFKTVNTQTDTSYSQIWNENSGGGIQYYNNPRNRLSFVGVNKSSDSDEVDVQIYTKDKTSNIGTRINVSASKGMFYLKDCTNLGFPEEREVAVKEDLPDMSKYLTAAQIKSGYASKWDAIQTAMDFTDACWGGLTDKFWSTSSQDAGVGYFITKKIESDKSYSMLSNNTQVVLQNSNKTTGNVATVIVNSDGAYYTKNTENTTYTSNDELITRKEYNELLLRIEALENNAS